MVFETRNAELRIGNIDLDNEVLFELGGGNLEDNYSVFLNKEQIEQLIVFLCKQCNKVK